MGSKRVAISPPSSPPRNDNFALQDDWLDDDIGLNLNPSKKPNKLSRTSTQKPKTSTQKPKTSTQKPAKRQRMSYEDEPNHDIEEISYVEESPQVPEVEEPMPMADPVFQSSLKR